MNLLELAQRIGSILDICGVFVILSGCILATVLVVINFFGHRTPDELYKSFRNNLAKSILLGLEFLVAGDIIRSITGNPNLTAVVVLVVIVLVRSFLSITFEMEIDGRWPWQQKRS